MSRRRLGRPLDVSRLARGLAIPGGDLRHWASYGTVAAVDDDGAVDLYSPNAVLVSPAGVEVDVVLEPSEYPVTCTHGIAAGTVFICGPIKVGDQVWVGIADGDVSMVPRILSVISGRQGAVDVVPVDGDGQPIFKNDRLLIFAKGVPIDMRTGGGSSLAINPDGSVVINGGTKGVARLDDPVSRTLSPADISAIASSAVGAGLLLPGSPTAPPQPVVLHGEAKISGASDTVKSG